MRLTFDEAELLNNFFGAAERTTKLTVLNELEVAKSNTVDPELINIANSTIQKIKGLDDNTFVKVFKEFPLNDFTDY